MVRMLISLPKRGLITESVPLGLFVSLYAISSTILIKGRKTASINTPMLIVSSAMLVFSTIHIGADLERVLDAFLNPNVLPKDYLPDVNNPLYILKTTAYVLQTLIGDGFLIYRVYLVWQWNRFIVLPLSLLILGSTGSCS